MSSKWRRVSNITGHRALINVSGQHHPLCCHQTEPKETDMIHYYLGQWAHHSSLHRSRTGFSIIPTLLGHSVNRLVMLVESFGYPVPDWDASHSGHEGRLWLNWCISHSRMDSTFMEVCLSYGYWRYHHLWYSWNSVVWSSLDETRSLLFCLVDFLLIFCQLFLILIFPFNSIFSALH